MLNKPQFTNQPDCRSRYQLNGTAYQSHGSVTTHTLRFPSKRNLQGDYAFIARSAKGIGKMAIYP
jgi:hypothetical protein